MWAATVRLELFTMHICSSQRDFSFPQYYRYGGDPVA